MKDPQLPWTRSLCLSHKEGWSLGVLDRLKTTVPGKYLHWPSSHSLSWKYELNEKHLTKVFVYPHWELCPADSRNCTVNNALASSSPWSPEQWGRPTQPLGRCFLRGRTGQSQSMESLIPRCQGPDMVLALPYWLEGEPPP